MAQISRHVQAPAVDGVGWLGPLFCDPEDFLAQFAAAFVVQLGQRFHAPPAVVILAILELEIIAVRALGIVVSAGLIASRLLVDALPVHPFVEGSAVVEHAVQDDLHAPAVQLAAEPGEPGIAFRQVLFVRRAQDILPGMSILMLVFLQQVIFIVENDGEVRVHVVVVLGVVFMGGGRYENGVEINCLHPQALQVIQLFQHALQVAAIEHAVIADLRQLVPVFRVADIAAGIIVLVVAHIVEGIAVAEAVGENLVLQRPLRPGGHVEPGNQVEGVGRIGKRHGIGIGRAGAAVVDIFTLPGH